MDKKAFQNSGKSIIIDVANLNLETILNIISNYFEKGSFERVKIFVPNNVKEKINSVRQKVERIDKPVYGINTGFGKLFNKIISDNKLQELQCNLIYSHTAGYGKKINDFVVFLTLLIRLRQLLIGYSGISWEMIEKIIDLVENQELPEIPFYTSVGASGDLIPLSHIFLKIIENYNPKPKESIAFINGTSYSLANFIIGLFFIEKLIDFSNFVIVVSSIAGNIDFSHFSEKLKKTKFSKYFRQVIEDINDYINLNSFFKDRNTLLQAPYSYRCYPQIMESMYGLLDLSCYFAQSELNSNTDNPLVVDEEFISAGNFHGNTISTLSDHLKIHIFQVANMSFQRMNHLLNPDFIIADEGLNSGFMISHYLASHLLVELKNNCLPISMENFPVSLNQEDLVSFSENNSKKLLKCAYLSSIILSIEFMLALQRIKLNNIQDFNWDKTFEKFFKTDLREVVERLPIRNDKDFESFGSLSNFQEKFIKNNRLVSFFEEQFDL